MTTTTEQTSQIHLPTGIRVRYVEQGPADAPDLTVLLHGWLRVSLTLCTHFTMVIQTPTFRCGQRLTP
jgi:hypothetical protein